MHVAYFLSRFPHLTTTFTLNEMLSLQNLGNEVSIVSLRQAVDLQGKAPQRTQSLNNATIYAPLTSPAVWIAFLKSVWTHPRVLAWALWSIMTEAFPNPFAVAKVCFALSKAPYLGRRLREVNVEHLHADFASLPATAAMFVSQLTQIPFSFTCHAFDLHAKSPLIKNSLLKSKIQHASIVISEHAHGRRFLLESFGRQAEGKIVVVRTGVDTTLFAPSPPPDNDQGILFLTVASLVEKKGYDVLLHACQLLTQRSLVFRCRIIGDGPLRRQLLATRDRLGLQDFVEFLGSMPNEEILPWYAKATAFVLPCVIAKNGDIDGIPTVLIESMSCGIATISTCVAGIPELVRDDHTGLLVEPNNPYALADAMERVAVDDKLRNSLGFEGRKWVEQHFDSVTNARRMSQLFLNHGRDIAPDPLADQQECRASA